MSNDGLVQNSSNMISSTKNKHINVDVDVHEEQKSNGNNCKNYPGNSEENSREFSSVSRSVIDGLLEKNIDKRGTSLVNKIHTVIFHFFCRV